MQDLGNKALLQETGTSQQQPHLSCWAVGYSRLAPPPQAPSHSNLLSKYRLQSTRDVAVLVTHRFLPYGDLDVRITLQEEKETLQWNHLPNTSLRLLHCSALKGVRGPPHLGVKQESWNPRGMPPETLRNLRPPMPSLNVMTPSKECQSTLKAKKHTQSSSGFLKGITRVFTVPQ